jgi:hypothetical protein
LHDGGIIHAVNNHLLDSGLLESFLFLKVSRNLLTGSGGCKGSRKTDNNYVLSGTILSNIYGARTWEHSVKDFNGGDFGWGCKGQRSTEATGCSGCHKGGDTKG